MEESSSTQEPREQALHEDRAAEPSVPTTGTGSRCARRFHTTPVGLTTLLGLAVVAGFGAYQRIGTTACATDIETHQSLEGGCVAVGYSEDRPGFLLLSSLPPSRVPLRADVRRSSVAGTYSVLRLPNGDEEWTHRLRGPVLITIDRLGQRTLDRIDWTREEFDALRASLDCTSPSALGKKRCGRPFQDVADLLATLEPTRVPKSAIIFLASRDVELNRTEKSAARDAGMPGRAAAVVGE